jgi:hypothetical protein
VGLLGGERKALTAKGAKVKQQGMQKTYCYTDTGVVLLYVPIRRPEVNLLRTLVFQLDADAFIITGQGYTACGEGFQLGK